MWFASRSYKSDQQEGTLVARNGPWLLFKTHGPLWDRSAGFIGSPQWTLKNRGMTSLHLSADVAFWYKSQCHLWWLIMEAVSQRTFQAGQVHHQLLPSKIDAMAALRDRSLVQSFGTEIEAHPWQSRGDMTHHRRIIWKGDKWKT